MHTLRDRPILALVQEDMYREAVVWCAEEIAAAGHARLFVFGPTPCLSRASAQAPFLRDDGQAGFGESGLDAARQFAQNERPAMLCAEWPTDPDPHETLRFASSLNVPGVFVRWSMPDPVDRVLIPTSGGPNAFRQLWIAKEIAAQCGAPAQALHIIQDGPDAQGPSAGSPAEVALAEAQARAMGISEPVEVRVADDVASGIVSATRPNDLVVIGAPNYWRMAAHFAGSIPDQIAQRTPNPLLMIQGRKPSHVRLRDIFWPQMIRLGLEPAGKEEAIAALVHTLVAHNQVPHAWRDLLLERALEREQAMSTGTGNETAFPHITLPDFIGVAGCMGIVPAGVDFDGDRGRNTRFVFLLVTPEDIYDEYLAVLCKIAERMVLPALRRELLECRTPADVLNVLDPDE